jgi:hypothetical protein
LGEFTELLAEFIKKLPTFVENWLADFPANNVKNWLLF